MLHSLTLHSCDGLLHVLQSQLVKAVEVKDIVKPIPEDVEEQEKILQVWKCRRGQYLLIHVHTHVHMINVDVTS